VEEQHARTGALGGRPDQQPREAVAIGPGESEPREAVFGIRPALLRTSAPVTANNPSDRPPQTSRLPIVCPAPTPMSTPHPPAHRERSPTHSELRPPAAAARALGPPPMGGSHVRGDGPAQIRPVSFTHLTMPTNLPV